MTWHDMALHAFSYCTTLTDGTYPAVQAVKTVDFCCMTFLGNQQHVDCGWQTLPRLLQQYTDSDSEKRISEFALQVLADSERTSPTGTVCLTRVMQMLVKRVPQTSSCCAAGLVAYRSESHTNIHPAPTRTVFVSPF